MTKEKEVDGMKVVISEDPMVAPAVHTVLNRLKEDIDQLIEEDMNTFAHYLVKKYGLFQNERDIKLFLLESASKELTGGEIDFPIAYYEQEEEIPESKKIVKTGSASVDTNLNEYVKKME